jgi:hypothetical protein
MKKLALALSLFLVSGIAFADSPKDSPKTDAPAAKPDAPAAKSTTAAKSDALAAKSATTAKPAVTKTNAEISAEMEELRQALQAQQEQLQLLKEELAKRDRQIEEAREAAASANSRASEATVKATEAVNTSAEVKSTTSALGTTVANMEASNAVINNGTASSAGGGQSPDEGPATIRFKGVNITPGGFIAAETVTRSHAESADINSSFTNIPFAAADLSHVPETNFSARQSRLSMLVQTKIGSVNATGYFEGDFLGAGTTSNNRQTNSYVYRQRQIWAQAATESGWIFTAGQMWTLATEDKKGELNRLEDLPLMIDPNYVVGFTWARQYGARFVKDFGGKFSLGFSIEGPQATIGGRGFSSVTTINSAAAPATILTTGATSATTGNFFLNAPGLSGGLYNAFDSTGYTVNKAPDFIVKAAADPSHFGHYELFGIVSTFRDRVYPCGVVGTTTADTVPGTATLSCTIGGVTSTTVSSAGARNSGGTGGGIGASALWSLFNKKLDIGIKAVGGDGIGRYGSAQLADATAYPNGSLALIRTAHGLTRAELHPTPKLDLYAYWGLEYAWRAGYTGYEAITITKTTAIPATATSPAIPATTHTTISTTGIGGYGNRAANNSGCATEGVPVNDFNPSAGANCAGDIRLIQEPTIGFWYKFYQGPKGRFQFGVQYSYLAKVAWSGTGGVPAGGTPISPKGIDNMVWTSFRYYLP